MFLKFFQLGASTPRPSNLFLPIASETWTTTSLTKTASRTKVSQILRKHLALYHIYTTSTLFATTMASHSKGKSSRHILVESQGLTSWRGSSSNGPSLIISLVNEAAHSPIAELKQAASITITILRNIKVWTLQSHCSRYPICGSRTEFTVYR